MQFKQFKKWYQKFKTTKSVWHQLYCMKKSKWSLKSKKCIILFSCWRFFWMNFALATYNQLAYVSHLDSFLDLIFWDVKNTAIRLCYRFCEWKRRWPIWARISVINSAIIFCSKRNEIIKLCRLLWILSLRSISSIQRYNCLKINLKHKILKESFADNSYIFLHLFELPFYRIYLHVQY